MNATDDPGPVIHLFCSVDGTPEHLRVTTCDRCGALVADEALHAAHHEAEGSTR